MVLCVIGLTVMHHCSHCYASLDSLLCIIGLTAMRHWSHCYASLVSLLCIIGLTVIFPLANKALWEYIGIALSVSPYFL